MLFKVRKVKIVFDYFYNYDFKISKNYLIFNVKWLEIKILFCLVIFYFIYFDSLVVIWIFEYKNEFSYIYFFIIDLYKVDDMVILY